MKLLHCGDFHLDAKMETGLDPIRARERRAELLLSFSRVVEAAAEQGAQAILLAGDLFDTERVTEKTRRYVGDIIASHPSIQFLFVTGNHDRRVPPLFENGEPPCNWHAFPSDGWDSISLGEGVVVSGTSAPDLPGVFDCLPHTEPDAFHIVLLHGQIVRGSEAGEDRIPLKRLAHQGIHYLALGHEHSFRCEPLDAHGCWAYAGCPEGRGFDECGEKGCILLDTCAADDNKITFLPLAKRTLHHVSVALDHCTGFGDVIAAIEAAISDISTDDMVKVVLTGMLPPEIPHDTVYLSQWLNDRFYFARVKDDCRLLVRPEDYLGDISLKGEFIRAVLASNLSDQQKQKTIACGLRALRGEEVDA